MPERAPGPPRSLRIHVVLYQHAPRDIAQTLTFLDASIGAARRAGVLDTAQVVLGDCSAEPVAASVREFAAGDLINRLQLEYHFFDANLGSGGGNNALWKLRREAVSELLVLNPDTVVSPRLVTNLLTALQGDGRIGVCDARQIPMEHPKAYDPATLDVSWASGACMMVRADVFEELGGFDESNFPLYCDDVDFSWRARLAGYRCTHVPTAVVFHDKRPSSHGRPEVSEAERYWAVLAGLLMATRWGRPDVAAALREQVAEDPDHVQQRAMEEFDRREREGLLPNSIPGADSVAVFDGGNYAEHRF